MIQPVPVSILLNINFGQKNGSARMTFETPDFGMPFTVNSIVEITGIRFQMSNAWWSFDQKKIFGIGYKRIVSDDPKMYIEQMVSEGWRVEVVDLKEE